MEPSYPAVGLQVVGIISVIIGIGLTAFHRLIGWQRDFSKISALNRKVFTTIHIATTLFLLGAGTFACRYAAMPSGATQAASVVCLTLCAFWGWRLVWQLLYFRPSRTEHDRRLAALHYVLVLPFAALVAGHAMQLAAGGGI